MKTKIITILMVLLSLQLFNSCNEEKEEIGRNSNKAFQEAKMIIESMGFDTSTLVECDKYYIVEGDISFPKDSIKSYNIKTKQYRMNNYITNLKVITIGIDNTISTNTSWRTALKNCIDTYNRQIGLTFIYSENNPNINITRATNIDPTTCAISTAPSSSQSPGNQIQINSSYNNLSLSQQKFLLMHEIGHAIGLRHTNGILEGDAGIGLIQIPGTPTIDTNSFMNANTCGNSWTNFSDYDIIALKALWPIKYITFSGYDYDIKIIPGSYLDRSICPESSNSIFSGWYKDAALTIPWKYNEQIYDNLKLYSKWRSRISKTTIETDTYRGSRNFTMPQTTGVALTAKIGRGLNEWWDISKYSGTFAMIGYTSATMKRINLNSDNIWNASPESYQEFTEYVVLDAGEHWLASGFPSELGPQNGASYKHGITYAIVTY